MSAAAFFALQTSTTGGRNPNTSQKECANSCSAVPVLAPAQFAVWRRRWQRALELKFLIGRYGQDDLELLFVRCQWCEIRFGRRVGQLLEQKRAT